MKQNHGIMRTHNKNNRKTKKSIHLCADDFEKKKTVKIKALRIHYSNCKSRKFNQCIHGNKALGCAEKPMSGHPKTNK